MKTEKITQLVVGPVATNCWIYKIDNNTAAVIDPGDEAVVIISALKELDLVPKYILLTHGHFDHIAALYNLQCTMHNAQLSMRNEQGAMSSEREEGTGNSEKGEGRRKKVEIAIHRADADYLGPGSFEKHNESIKAATGDGSFVKTFWPKDGNGNLLHDGMPSATRLLEEGDTIGPFTVLHLPGHTPGSVAFWDKEGNVLFTGDTLFKSGYGRTDLPGGDEKALIASLRRLFAMDAGIVVCPGHGGVTSIGRESK